MNISLGDYLRGLTNNHHSKTEWTLDPRIVINSDGGVPRGVGNQVSLEFNLLYRFHPAISLRDEKWTEDFFSKVIFPEFKKPLEELNPVELFEGLIRFDAMIPKDPSKRQFGGMKRGPDGRFKDGDLVAALKASMEDPAGKTSNPSSWHKTALTDWNRTIWCSHGTEGAESCRSSGYSSGPQMVRISSPSTKGARLTNTKQGNSVTE